MEEDSVDVDSENYRNVEKYGYKDLALKQVARVMNNLSREQREGFWVYSNNPQGPSQKIKYVGDARKESIQSIETLYDLLLPRFDKTITEETKNFDVNLENELAPLKEEFENTREEGSRKDLVEESWKIKRRHYRKLFQQLCRFLERLGWFETASVEDQ